MIPSTSMDYLTSAVGPCEHSNSSTACGSQLFLYQKLWMFYRNLGKHSLPWLDLTASLRKNMGKKTSSPVVQKAERPKGARQRMAAHTKDARTAAPAVIFSLTNCGGAP